MQHSAPFFQPKAPPTSLQDQRERCWDSPFPLQVGTRSRTAEQSPPAASWTSTCLPIMKVQWLLFTRAGGKRHVLKPCFLDRLTHPSMLRRHSWAKGYEVTEGQPAPDKPRDSRGRSTLPSCWHEPLNSATRAREGGFRPGTQTALRSDQQKGLLFGKAGCLRSRGKFSVALSFPDFVPTSRAFPALSHAPVCVSCTSTEHRPRENQGAGFQNSLTSLLFCVCAHTRVCTCPHVYLCEQVYATVAARGWN